MRAVVAAFNQEKALVGAFSVIVQLHWLIHLRHDLEPMAAMKEQDGGWWWLICQDLAFLLSLCVCCLAAGWMKNWLAGTGQLLSHTGHRTPAKHPVAILNCGNIDSEKQTQRALVAYLIVLVSIRCSVTAVQDISKLAAKVAGSTFWRCFDAESCC